MSGGRTAPDDVVCRSQAGARHEMGRRHRQARVHAGRRPGLDWNAAGVLTCRPPRGCRPEAQRAEIAQLVEHATENRGVASSILALGTTQRARMAGRHDRAEVAQLVEHHLAKVRVAGSSPVFRSTSSLRRPSTTAGPSSSGRTADFGSVNRGSNPRGPANHRPGPQSAGRRTQVVKGEVCKTSIQRFESARRLHVSAPHAAANGPVGVAPRSPADGRPRSTTGTARPPRRAAPA